MLFMCWCLPFFVYKMDLQTCIFGWIIMDIYNVYHCVCGLNQIIIGWIKNCLAFSLYQDIYIDIFDILCSEQKKVPLDILLFDFDILTFSVVLIFTCTLIFCTMDFSLMICSGFLGGFWIHRKWICWLQFICKRWLETCSSNYFCIMHLLSVIFFKKDWVYVVSLWHSWSSKLI